MQIPVTPVAKISMTPLLQEMSTMDETSHNFFMVLHNRV
jgi:hypothetical protein